MTLKTYHIVGIIIPYTLCCCLRIWESTPSICETLSPNKRVPSLSKLCILYSRQCNVFLACTHITNRSEAGCMMELGCGNGGTSITIQPHHMRRALTVTKYQGLEKEFVLELKVPCVVTSLVLVKVFFFGPESLEKRLAFLCCTRTCTGVLAPAEPGVLNVHFVMSFWGSLFVCISKHKYMELVTISDSATGHIIIGQERNIWVT